MKKSSTKDYEKFIKIFPFSCVDVLLFKDNAILLTKRTRNPYKNYWHLPGHMIRKNESMIQAVKRAAKNELNLNVTIKKYVGVFESLNSFRHDISHGFVVKMKSGNIKTDFQSKEMKFFKRIPRNTIPHQKKMIKEAKRSLNEK
tara:strand:+ start:193 stop:624 length:432 start_codon:yes stop_codon:yes gene_type:complete